MVDLTNRIFGRLRVIAEAPRVHSMRRWHCRCTCGETTTAYQADLARKHTQSCGCHQRERTGAAARTHGASNTGLYRVWRNMKTRCLNPLNSAFKDYGGRGIRICDRWIGPHGFQLFTSDMGPPPLGATIDRIDNNGHYAPDNCRWASRKEQVSNRRNTVALSFEGRTMLIAEWAKERGMKRRTLAARILRGWPVDRALNVKLRRW